MKHSKEDKFPKKPDSEDKLIRAPHNRIQNKYRNLYINLACLFVCIQ